MPARPQLRRLAAYVLLVWLFALASGVASACVVQTNLHHAAHVHGASHAIHVHAAAASDTAVADSSAGHNGDHTRPPCARLCDEPPAAPQADKQQTNPLSGFWLAAAPLPSLQFQTIAALRDSGTGPEPRSRATVPIPIVFLRLAL